MLSAAFPLQGRQCALVLLQTRYQKLLMFLIALKDRHFVATVAKNC